MRPLIPLLRLHTMRGATPGARRVTAVAIAAAVVVLVAVGGLFWAMRGGTTTAGSPRHAERTTAATTPTSVPAPSVAKVAPAGTDELAPDGTARPQPVPLDPSAKPPSLDAPHSKPAPPQQPFTREETIAKREADLKLLDDTKTRLEADLAAARTANDASAAHDLEVRIARMSELRKKRGAELETIRAGGALPQ